MTYKTMLALASAVLLSASGAAIAAEHHDKMGNMGEPNPAAQNPEQIQENSYLKGIRNVEMVPSDRALLDAPVLSADGHQIGEVTRITPDGVVISVGRTMGIGTHKVLVKPVNLTATRARGKLSVISSLNAGQLENMPEYQPGGAVGGSMR